MNKNILIRLKPRITLANGKPKLYCYDSCVMVLACGQPVGMLQPLLDLGTMSLNSRCSW
jgi:hypothetical protein